MERISISLDSMLAEQFDEFIHGGGYTNRSEAIRDLIRARIEEKRIREWQDGHCVATLSYVYNHHEAELARRITSAHHHHHELVLSSMHVHLDHDHCLETVILRGPIKVVRDFAAAVMAERGVRHGKLHMIPVEIEDEGHGDSSRPHIHSHPKT